MMTSRNGFSLVELSIVLVILGLLTGGIIGGMSLIKAAELRSVAKELNQFQMAISVFQDEYRALPGDMDNAHRYWGLLPGATEGGTCPNTGSADALTCNGDDDGIVEFGGESRHVWKHLANANLIQGHYSGKYEADQMPGITGPKSGYDNGMWGWGSSYWISNLGQTSENPLILGKPGYPGIEGTVDSPLLSTSHAFNIDSKMDDSLPENGKVQAFDVSGAGNCVDSGEYKLSEDVPNACTMVFFFVNE